MLIVDAQDDETENEKETKYHNECCMKPKTKKKTSHSEHK